MFPNSSPQSLSPSHLWQIWLIRELCSWHTKWRGCRDSSLDRCLLYENEDLDPAPQYVESQAQQRVPTVPALRRQRREETWSLLPASLAQPVSSRLTASRMKMENYWEDSGGWPTASTCTTHAHTGGVGRSWLKALWCARTSWGLWGLLRALPQMRGNGIPSPLQTPGWVLYS